MKKTVFSLGALFALFSLTGCFQKSEDVSREKVEPIVKDIIHEMLDKEPELFVKAIDKAVAGQQQKALEDMERRATDAQHHFWASPLVMGNKEAKLKLGIFFDPMDPISQKFKAEVIDPLMKERSDIGFFFVPISVYGAEKGKGPSSIEATEMVIWAAKQNPKAALSILSKLPTVETELTMTQLTKFVTDAGLDGAAFEAYMKTDDARKSLYDNGKIATGIRIPPQMPCIFVTTPEGKLVHIPPFILEKMRPALDAIAQGKSWRIVLEKETSDAVAPSK